MVELLFYIIEKIGRVFCHLTIWSCIHLKHNWHYQPLGLVPENKVQHSTHWISTSFSVPKKKSNFRVYPIFGQPQRSFFRESYPQRDPCFTRQVRSAAWCPVLDEHLPSSTLPQFEFSSRPARSTWSIWFRFVAIILYTVHVNVYKYISIYKYTSIYIYTHNTLYIYIIHTSYEHGGIFNVINPYE